MRFATNWKSFAAHVINALFEKALFHVKFSFFASRTSLSPLSSVDWKENKFSPSFPGLHFN
jgi:hypothetical protein